MSLMKKKNEMINKSRLRDVKWKFSISIMAYSTLAEHFGEQHTKKLYISTENGKAEKRTYGKSVEIDLRSTHICTNYTITVIQIHMTVIANLWLTKNIFFFQINYTYFYSN